MSGLTAILSDGQAGADRAASGFQGICAFCQQARPLRNSHIIPEFLYRTLYDEKHRFSAYGSDGKAEVVQEQKGTRERLL